MVQRIDELWRLCDFRETRRTRIRTSRGDPWRLPRCSSKYTAPARGEKSPLRADVLRGALSPDPFAIPAPTAERQRSHQITKRGMLLAIVASRTAANCPQIACAHNWEHLSAQRQLRPVSTRVPEWTRFTRCFESDLKALPTRWSMILQRILPRRARTRAAARPCSSQPMRCMQKGHGTRSEQWSSCLHRRLR